MLFVTGAGISADSGIPTYRGVGGLYEDRTVEARYTIEELLSGTTFRREPALTWRYLAEIELACRGCLPNAAHAAIAALESDAREVWVITQNVDGLHHRAGSSNVIDIHGHVYSLYCPRCDYRDEVEDFSRLAVPPPCPECGAIIRPDVVLFEEMLPVVKVQTMAAELRRGFDLVLSIGTSSLFPYIVAPVIEAARQGVPTVEINPGATSISELVQYRIERGAADAMTRIAAAL